MRDIWIKYFLQDMPNYMPTIFYLMEKLVVTFFTRENNLERCYKYTVEYWILIAILIINHEITNIFFRFHIP